MLFVFLAFLEVVGKMCEERLDWTSTTHYDWGVHIVDQIVINEADSTKPKLTARSPNAETNCEVVRTLSFVGPFISAPIGRSNHQS